MGKKHKQEKWLVHYWPKDRLSDSPPHWCALMSPIWLGLFTGIIISDAIFWPVDEHDGTCLVYHRNPR